MTAFMSPMMTLLYKKSARERSGGTRFARSPLVNTRGRKAFMKALFWIGLAMVVCWGVLWLGIKIAVAAVHLLLIVGIVLIGWALLRGATRSSR